MGAFGIPTTQLLLLLIHVFVVRSYVVLAFRPNSSSSQCCRLFNCLHVSLNDNVEFISDERSPTRRQNSPNTIDDSARRKSLRAILSSALLPFALPANAFTDIPLNRQSSYVAPPATTVTVPLEFTGQELLIYYRVDGSLFRAVVDTGSPFLMIPGSCGANTRQKAGCYREQGIPSGLPNTFERFDGFEGDVEWRKAPVNLVDATGSLMGPPLIIFGVVSESILSGPGGLFFGLLRDTDSWIRPSFLGQTSIEAFQLDLRSRKSKSKTLTLSTSQLIEEQNTKDCIRLTTELNRKYGDPVCHYTAKAQSISVNGAPLVARDGRPIYIIFDTGVTGMVVSRELFDERYAAARQRRERSLWGNVGISFRTEDGGTVTLEANKPLTTPFDPRQAWKRFHGHLIVMGLSFLDGNRITIDIDRQRLLLEASEEFVDDVSAAPI